MVTATDQFKQVKTHLATLDDLGQERRRLYTDWATQRLTPDEFASAMAANLRRTQEAAAILLTTIQG